MCLIIRCVPKKIMYLAAHMRQYFDDGDYYSYSVNGDVRFDWPTFKSTVLECITDA